MRTSIFLAGLFLVIISINCCTSTRDKSAEELLNDPKMEEKMFAAILSDQNYFTKFMNKAMVDEKSKLIIIKNRSLMKMLCMSENMDTVMHNDLQLKEAFTDRF